MDALKNIFAQVFSDKNIKMLQKMGKQAFDLAKTKSAVLMKEAKKFAEQKGKEVSKKADEVKKETTKKAAEVKKEATKKAADVKKDATKKVEEVKKEAAKATKKKAWFWKCGCIVIFYLLLMYAYEID